jgi:C4-dicarboxylate transporter DctM subunit
MDTLPSIIMVFVIMTIFLTLGFPIAVSLGLTGLVSIYFLVDKNLIGASGYLGWNMSTDFVLCAIPLFVLMGEFLSQSVLSQLLYEGVAAWLGRLPGGLLHTNIWVSAVFGAMCGSAVAAAATIGGVAYPQLEKRGYDAGLSAGTIAAGATLSLIIPPSGAMIVYGALTGVSVGKLFMGGFIPGILMAGLFSLYVAVVIMLKPELKAAVPEAVSLKTKMLLLVRLFPAAILIFAVLGVIYLGVATPTEAAAMGAFCALLIILGYRALTFDVLKKALFNTVKTTSMILFIVVGANIFAFALNQLGAASAVLGWMKSFTDQPIVVLALIYVFYLILGCVLDGISMVVMTLSIVFPIITGLGFDPVWFGVALTMLVAVGNITPPVGLVLYVLQGVTKKELFYLGKASIPFVILEVVAVILVTIWPDLILWLPSKVI